MKLALINATLYDGVASASQPETTVLIEGERIVEVGPSATIVVPPDAETVDVAGRMILPGLIDLHNHCTWQHHFENPVTRTFRSPRSDVYLALAAVPKLEEALSAGLTTLRDCGSVGETIYDLRDAIGEGLIVGPQLHVAGQVIEPTGGPHPTEPRTIIEADGVDAVRAAVRRQLKRGADFIKVAINNAEWTEDELGAAVDEAHRRGVKVACHVVFAPSVKMAIAAGVDSLEHARSVDDEDARKMADLGISLVAVVSGMRDKLPIGEAYLEHTLLSPELRRNVEATLEHSRPLIEAQPALIESALNAGVMIGAGTDRTGAYGQDPFADIVRELEVLVDLGVPTDLAIKSATSTAASIMGVDQTVGTVVSGRLADLIVVDGNPLTDIGTLRNIVHVIKRGEVVVSPAQPA